MRHASRPSRRAARRPASPLRGSVAPALATALVVLLALVLGAGCGSAEPTVALHRPPAEASPAPAASDGAIAAIQLSSGDLTLGEGDSVQVRATVRGTDGGVLAGRTVRWTSTDSTVAAIAADGVVRGRRAGVAIAYAAVGDVRASFLVLVTRVEQPGVPTGPVGPSEPRAARVRVTVADSVLSPGDSTRAIAAALDAEGNVLPYRVVFWRSSAGHVLGPVGAGPATWVHAYSGGTADLVATADGVEGSARLTVRSRPTPPGRAAVARVVVEVDDAPLVADGALAVRAWAVDGTGVRIADRAPWLYSSARETAIVRNDSAGTAPATVGVKYGSILGVSAGTTTIVAELEGRLATLVLQVAPRPPRP